MSLSSATGTGLSVHSATSRVTMWYYIVVVFTLIGLVVDVLAMLLLPTLVAEEYMAKTLLVEAEGKVEVGTIVVDLAIVVCGTEVETAM